MSFKLSQRSLSKLEGVNERLVTVVKTAIDITEVDFGVLEGVRTIERQKKLVERGASKTMKSRHLDGLAVDLIAYVDNRISWELCLYDEIADAIKAAAKAHNVPVRWGGAWNVPDITVWEGDMSSAMGYYIDYKRAQNKKPFIDGPHFELI
jgi:peptidoglycan L-alanyl-D-glutamate endopeptidase CwlK